MSVDIPDRVCGCLGCTDDAVDTIEHPTHGQRAVCQKHRDELEVNGGV